MRDPTPELEKHLRLLFAQAKPERIFSGCKIATEGDQIFVRIYSQRAEGRSVMPPPYEIFRFDAVSDTLISPTREEATRYAITNYK